MSSPNPKAAKAIMVEKTTPVELERNPVPQNTVEEISLFAHAVAAELRKNPRANIEALKIKLAPKFSIHGVLKNAAILMALSEKERTPEMTALLRTRLTRTGSGVTPVAVMPKPFPCPGLCTFCPQGENAPKAYTGFEPATMRAIQNEYDAGKQVRMRLDQYAALGQPSGKCELILMGGTFLAVPYIYRNQFVKECYEAFNGKKSETLVAAQTLNESAAHRVIGLTVETRPDWCKRRDIDEMLTWGATRVELGVQSLDDDALLKVKRGHTAARAAQATAELKNACFKVGYHFMPGMYSTRAQDVSMLKEIFTNSAYCPDMLKVYPCLVMPGTPLFEEWKAGKFTPIETEEAVARVAEATAHFPTWVRVMRMQRDIPAFKIAAGVKAGNLHQMIQRTLSKRGTPCRCIRCREVFGAYRREEGGSRKKLKLGMVEQKYNSSGGLEHFLSFEDIDQDLLAGFIRLRLPPQTADKKANGALPPSMPTWPLPHRPEITSSTALIRELHVYGQELEVGPEKEDASSRASISEHTGRSSLASSSGRSSSPSSHLVCEPVQHRGLGQELLARATEIAQADGRDKMTIISGVGARPYYAKLGYTRDGPYMSKKI